MANGLLPGQHQPIPVHVPGCMYECSELTLMNLIYNIDFNMKMYLFKPYSLSVFQFQGDVCYVKQWLSTRALELTCPRIIFFQFTHLTTLILYWAVWQWLNTCDCSAVLQITTSSVCDTDGGLLHQLLQTNCWFSTRLSEITKKKQEVDCFWQWREDKI